MTDRNSSLWAATRRYDAVSVDISRHRADTEIDWLRTYAARRVNSQLMDERRCIPPYVALDFADAGLFGWLIEEKYQGQALRVEDTVRVLEQLAALDLSLCTWMVTSVFGWTRALSVWATDEVKDEWLPKLATGRAYGAYAQTELTAGSDFTSLATEAHPTESGGWRLSGHKHWIGNGSWAGVLTVMAQQVDSGGEPMGLAAFAVPTSSSGVRLGKEHLSLGLRGMVQSHIHFDDVAVGTGQLLGSDQGALGGALVAVDLMTMTRLAFAALGRRDETYRPARPQVRIPTTDLLGLPERASGHPGVARRDHPPHRGRRCDRARGAARRRPRRGDGTHGGGQGTHNRVAGQRGGPAGPDPGGTWIRRGGHRGTTVPRCPGVPNIRGHHGDARRLPRRQSGHPTRTHRRPLAEAGAPELARRLRSAVNELKSREIASIGVRGDNRGWRLSLAGKALMWAFAVAAVRRTKGNTCSTLPFPEKQFSTAIIQARSGSPAEMLLASWYELERTSDSYAEQIGDIEQTLPGAETRLDPLLKKQD
jgi:alkylation response protein AidB-like acyl-CoA dehydrogenase